MNPVDTRGSGLFLIMYQCHCSPSWNILPADPNARLVEIPGGAAESTDQAWPDTAKVFGRATRVTRVSLTGMRNTNTPGLQPERLELLSDNSNLVYQGHTGRCSCTIKCR